MRSTLPLCALLAALSGCSTASLPYKPEFPPSGRTISADYLVLADRLRVEIDTGGYRLGQKCPTADHRASSRGQQQQHRDRDRRRWR